MMKIMRQQRNALEGVNSDLLSVEAKSMYDAIMGDIGSSVKQKYQSTAMDAYESGDYATAIENYTKALDIGEPDFTSMFYLAQAYQKSGDTDNAKTWYQKIIDTLPWNTECIRCAGLFRCIDRGKFFFWFFTIQSDAKSGRYLG